MIYLNQLVNIIQLLEHLKQHYISLCEKRITDRIISLMKKFTRFFKSPNYEVFFSPNKQGG